MKFICEQCGENTPMFHTGTNCANDEWLVLGVINADGTHLYELTDPDIETENLRAICGGCGYPIDGALYCAIAYPNEKDPEVTRGYASLFETE